MWVEGPDKRSRSQTSEIPRLIIDRIRNTGIPEIRRWVETTTTSFRRDLLVFPTPGLNRVLPVTNSWGQISVINRQVSSGETE